MKWAFFSNYGMHEANSEISHKPKSTCCTADNVGDRKKCEKISYKRLGKLHDKTYLCIMIELARHIEALLLEHDCVIVPHLGGFVAHYAPARLVPEEGLFLPPLRTVGFNSDLTLNDGLLVQSYMKAYDTSFPATVRMISDDVETLKQTLHQDGAYTFSGIGTLRLTLDGRYEFSPCEGGVLSPELYGLGSFAIRRNAQKLEKRTSQILVAPTALPAENTSTEPIHAKKSYTLTLNREIVNYVAAAVVAMIFYFMWTTPLTLSPSAHQASQAASFTFPLPTDAQIQKVDESAASANIIPQPNVSAHPSSSAEVKPVSHTTLQSSSNSEIATPKQISSETHKETATLKTTATASVKNSAVKANDAKATSGPSFTVVLSSGIPLANAERYVAELHAKGVQGARVLTTKRMNRVVCGRYTSENEANSAMKSLRAKGKEFADVWIYTEK